MPYCSKCKVEIKTSNKKCPLCQAKLNAENELVSSVFPDTPTVFSQFSLFFRIILFISIAVCVVAVFLNKILIKYNGFWWSLIVLLSVGAMWFIIFATIRRRKSISKSILYQIILTSIIVFIADLCYGFPRWSVNFVIPSLFVSCMLAISVVAIVTKKSLDDYLIYLLISVILGLLPLIFALTPLTTVKWPSYACTAISLVLLAGFWLFSKNDILAECKKRFHL